MNENKERLRAALKAVFLAVLALIEFALMAFGLVSGTVLLAQRYGLILALCYPVLFFLAMFLTNRSRKKAARKT